MMTDSSTDSLTHLITDSIHGTAADHWLLPSSIPSTMMFIHVQLVAGLIDQAADRSCFFHLVHGDPDPRRTSSARLITVPARRQIADDRTRLIRCSCSTASSELIAQRGSAQRVRVRGGSA